jgi:uncharacterized protein
MKNTFLKLMALLVILAGIVATSPVWADEAEDMARTLLGNDIPGVAKLLDRNPKLVDMQIGKAGPPLLYASSLGSTEMAQLLIERGAKVNIAGENRWTPLHFAAQRGDAKLAALLLSKGADMKAWTSPDGFTPLIVAAGFGSKDVVELLVSKGADVNEKDNEGRTALQFAAKIGRNDIALFLRAHGAKD